jgi:hypothetical protein
MRIYKLFTILALTAGLAAACGGNGDDDGVASTGGDGKPKATASGSKSLSPEDAQLKFAQCMRANGVNMPDPTPGQKGVRITSKQGDQAKTQAAMKKCQQYLQAGQQGTSQDPKAHDRMVKYAQCLRQHGIDMPDPKPGQPMKLTAKKGQETQLKQAQEACKSLQPGGGQ